MQPEGAAKPKAERAFDSRIGNRRKHLVISRGEQTQMLRGRPRPFSSILMILGVVQLKLVSD